MAAAATGLLSGTPTGKDFELVPCCWICTRARAFIDGTSLLAKNQGKPASVILTSTIFASQGTDSMVSSAGGPPTANIFLLIRTVIAPCFVPPIWSLYRVATVGSPAYLCVSAVITPLAVAASPK